MRVDIDVNPGRFLAGGPNWDPFSYWLPDRHDKLGAPPSDICRDWYTWATARNGVPAMWSRTRLVLTGNSESTILIDRFEVSVTRSDLPTAGSLTICRTGGADAIPQGVQVELDSDPPKYSWVETGGERVYSPIGLTLTRNEIDLLEVEARASQPGLYEWTATLGFVENGRRREVQIDNGGGPLLLVGGTTETALEWDGHGWQSFKA